MTSPWIALNYEKGIIDKTFKEKEFDVKNAHLLVRLFWFKFNKIIFIKY